MNRAGQNTAESEISGKMLAYLAHIPSDRQADVSPRDTTGVLHHTFIGNVNRLVNYPTMFITLQVQNNFHAAPCGGQDKNCAKCGTHVARGSLFGGGGGGAF
jgi:hypothetical protein